MADEQGKSGPPIRNLSDLIFTSESSGPPRRPSALEQLFYSIPSSLTPSPPPMIPQRWFKDQTIHIDGYTFERCRFDRCALVTEQATFSFRECFISPDCRIYFKGPALKVARLLMHVLQLQQRANARQVPDARLAVTTGYGMTMYRYGGTAAAAVLERVE